jgi:cholesterol transport system auxiliary component
VKNNARKYMTLVRMIWIVSSIGVLSSCALFSPAKPNQNTYVLNSIPHFVQTKSPRHHNLLITVPDAESAFDTTQMAYTTKPYGIAYYSRNRWVETPAQMLQPLIVQTLQKTHYFHAVVTSSFIGHYDYLLNTHIIKLQQNFLRTPITYEVAVQVELINATTNEILVTKQISIMEPVPQATPYGGVIAANRAIAKVLQLIATFCLKGT